MKLYAKHLAFCLSTAELLNANLSDPLCFMQQYHLVKETEPCLRTKFTAFTCVNIQKFLSLVKLKFLCL